MMSDKIKIALADDEELFRKGIYFLLQREQNFEVIFEAANGNQLIDFLTTNSNRPDIILMDLKMPLLNGVEATKLITQQFPDIKIIALTSYNTKSFIANMIEIGAASFLVKNASPKEMIFTINEVYKKAFYYNEQVIKILSEFKFPIENRSDFFEKVELTSREREVLELICQQFNSTEIAEQLFISPRTVDTHRNSLLFKTNSQNIAGLVLFAIQNKIVIL
ncbi:response regulator transcription factor [Flavobacterium sp.]|jgi:DNA-binding NarL/FixJ family response regulator|uniref:response regulator transcription factor n=2 Tax=Flavobacterium TaxID=237 RepID=UPI003390597B